MYTVYVIRSLNSGKRYIGFTQKNVKIRALEHDQNKNLSTRNQKWILIYYEKGYCKECALKREKFLKSGQGRKILDKIL